MLLEISLAIVAGILAGVFAGLLPGIHPNLVAVLVSSSSTFLLNYIQSLTLAIFIASMAISNVFISIIPSIFLGAPDAETALSILPGHKMLLQGRGFEAIAISTIGALAGIILAISSTPLIILLTKFLYNTTGSIIGYILIASCTWLILKDKESKIFALILFILSGCLGLAVLNSTAKEPLFPLLSGLFGTSSLLLSLKSQTTIPFQEITYPIIKKSKGTLTIILASLAGCIACILPGLGTSQIAALSSSFTKKIKGKYFLLMLGALNSVNIVVSFIALYAINRSRNGAVLAISRIIDKIGPKELILFLASTLIVAGISTILTLKISKVFSKIMDKINYEKLCITTLVFITLLVFLISSWFGILILLVSTSLGILPQLKGTNRNHLMGCLLLPIILFFIL